METLLQKYKPKDLEEAVQILEDLTKDFEEKDEWVKSNEDDAIIDAHHAIGRLIRNCWGLWTQDSQLYKWFEERGITHPDDISSIILT